MAARAWLAANLRTYGYDMVWYDMIWYGMVWYDLIWYDGMWCDMIWYDDRHWWKIFNSICFDLVVFDLVSVQQISTTTTTEWMLLPGTDIDIFLGPAV